MTNEPVTPQSTEGTTEGKRRDSGPFGGLSASEAGKASARKAAEKRAARKQGVTREDLIDIAQSLVTKAKQGRSAEAKLVLEYVRYLGQGEATTTGESAIEPEAMTVEQRQAVRARIAAELAGEGLEQAQEQG